MKEVMTKKEVCEWMKEQTDSGNNIPVVMNGGGFSWVNNDIIDYFVDDIMTDEYLDEVYELTPDEVFEDFEDFDVKTSKDAKNPVDKFLLIKHNTGYNCENFSIQLGFWQ